MSEHGIRLDPQATFEAWRSWLAKFGRMQRASQWCIGDLIVEGIARGYESRGRVYDDALAATGLARQTLKNYAVVARAIPSGLRDRPLAWEHFAIVAPLEQAEQADWLARAERLHLSAAELRRRLGAHRAELATRRRNRETFTVIPHEPLPMTDDADLELPDLDVRIVIDGARRAQWAAAAARNDQALFDWLIAVADRAASDVVDRRRLAIAPG